jgi:hypothetical protein
MYLRANFSSSSLSRGMNDLSFLTERARLPEQQR